ncbi:MULTISPECIES: hypothetical protein [Enterobacterales]|jgi:hypothetical protein|nr:MULTISPECIES: hypothetical protein [Enterobacteriaceae]HCH8289495.1 hypothetical protein [Salmonella enterica]HDG7897413.1 hypothetical protein [Klebsiella quasipneumoniae]EKR4449928.1 hypothetical protein [Klebsiella pneumoniae]EKU0711442.1 hypothetical protein [Klebsiella pneumoniae]EKW1830254.1 hypothetical protein [Klebsiella pneumoniae]
MRKTTDALIRDLNHNRCLLDRMKREGMDKVSDTVIVERAMIAIIAEVYIRGN